MLSIDIGSKKICIAEGKYRGDIVHISAFDETYYSQDVVENGNILDRPALSFLINELIKKNRIKAKDAIITISSSDTIIRELKLPDVKLNQLKMLVNNEMSRIVKDDNGFLIDFVVDGKADEQLLKIIAYAMPKSLVESYYKLLKEIKLKPHVLSVPEDAVVRLLQKSPINGEEQNEKNIIVIDIGYEKLSFYAFENGKSQFSRTDSSPLSDFVREVESISRLDADIEFMKSLSFDPDYLYEEAGMNEACRYFIFKLSEEIQKYIQYLQINSDMKFFDKIYLSGGIASAKGIADALSNTLHLPVELIKSLGRLKANEALCVSKYCVAAGAFIRK